MRLSINTKAIDLFRETGLLLFVFVCGIAIQLRNSNFLTWENINDLAANTAILSILAVGMMMVIITRGIDLSVAAILALVGMSVALTVSAYPSLHPIFALLMGVVLGTLCGAVVGLLVSKGRVLPIIATLGMMNVFRGVTFIISGGRWVSAHQMPASFKSIATGRLFGISNLLTLAIIVNVLFYYILTFSKFGRQVYAVGSNPRSAEISGINNDRIVWSVYTIMGALAGLAGVLWVSKFASAQGNTAAGYELTVIAACVLGGVSIAGGVGKISSILLGALLLGMLNNALPLINISPFWQNFIQGLIILFAVISNVFLKRRVDFATLKRRRI